MDAPLAARCAEILVDRDQGFGYGSGFQLTSDLMITARHVVAGGQVIRVRFSGSGKFVVRGRVLWSGMRVDLAIVKLLWQGDSPGRPVAPISIGMIPDDAEGRLGFTTIGFPRHSAWAAEDGAVWRDSDQLDGTIPLASSMKRGRLLLHRDDVRALPARDWSGYSGAPIICQGHLLGVVVTAEQSGTLEGVRIAAAVGEYEPGADIEREPADSARAAHKLLEEHAVAMIYVDARRRHAAYRTLLDDYAARCEQLLDRDDELAELAGFARGDEPYLWLAGAPWSGKTSLTVRLATDPPAGVDAVAFVVSRRKSDNRLGRYRRAVGDQLAALLGEHAAVEPAAEDLLDLWNRVAAAGRRTGRSLLLIIDGLDENDFLRFGEPSIASQLPRIIAPGAHVLVTSRAGMPLPGDVDPDHPLRTCRRRTLQPTAAIRIALADAQHELSEVLLLEEPRRVLATIAVGSGALRPLDLEDIAGVDRLRARRLLERDLARVVERRGSAGGNTVPYALAHDLLVEAVRTDLDTDEISAVRQSLHDWADRWSTLRWPEQTPPYLIDAYPNLLTAERDGVRLARLAAPARHALLRTRTLGEAAALRELSDAARLLSETPRCDLRLLSRVSFLRSAMQDATSAVPAAHPAALARLGRIGEAIQAARSLQNVYARSEALLRIAEVLAADDPRDAANLASEAASIPGRLAHEQAACLAKVAALLVRIDAHDAASQALAQLDALVHTPNLDEWTVGAVCSGIAEADRGRARRYFDIAVERAEEPLDFLCIFADVLIRIGRLDLLSDALDRIDSDDLLSWLLYACATVFREGGRRGIPASLQAILRAAVSDPDPRIARA